MNTLNKYINENLKITSPLELRISKGEFKDFNELLNKYHYKNNKIGGGISYNLVLKHKNKVVGGVVIGKMRHEKNYSKKAVELRRMVLSPDCPKNTASYFLSQCLKWIKKNTDIDIVYSFADTTLHKGTIYKASHFIEVKRTKPTQSILWNNKLYHARSLTIDRPYSYRMREALKTGEAQKVMGKEKILYMFKIKRKTHKNKKLTKKEYEETIE